MTAAKAGAKAIIRLDGTISAGWIGGGCARGAVFRAARDAIKDGEPRLVSVQPNELLERLGVAAGEAREGIEFAKNMCPSQGTMDIFVEPVLPRAQIVICGSSPVGVALAELARQFGFFVIACAPTGDHSAFGEVDRLADGFEPPNDYGGNGYIVVATQGRRDSAALKAALKAPSRCLFRRLAQKGGGFAQGIGGSRRRSWTTQRLQGSRRARYRGGHAR